MLSVCVFASAAPAESLPASVAACASEKDVLKRLSCFDREVAPFLKQPTPSDARPAAAAAAAAAPAAAAPVVAAPAAAAPAAAAPAAAAPAAAAPAAAAAAATGGAAVAASASAPGQPAKHIEAHIVRIENFPDEIVVHLDNDQVWQQVDPAPASPNLRTGDPVTIDRSMAAYCLSGPNGVAVKVRLKNKK
jgi:hypothetical protein